MTGSPAIPPRNALAGEGGRLPIALDRAIERVIAGYAHDPVVAPDDALLRREVEAVVQVIREALEVGSCDIRSGAQLDRVRLLGALRAETVRHWSTKDGSILPWMRAFEATHQALIARAEASSLAEMVEPSSRTVLREVAHLLRSPLGSVVMMADTLREERAGPLNSMQKRQLEIIYRAALSIAAAAGDLLTHLGDDQPEAAEPLALSEIVDGVVAIVRPVLEACGSDLHVHQAVGERRVGPPTTLTRILVALALRGAALTRGGSVEIGVEPSGSEVRFWVRARGVDAPDVDAGRARAPTQDALLRLFRVDAETGTSVLSGDALALTAAVRRLGTLGAELAIERPAPGELRLAFSLPLPRTL